MSGTCLYPGCAMQLDRRNKSGFCRSHRMKALNADPEFAKAHSERSRERMKALNADPEFAKANRERMKARHADPEFAKANRDRASERMKALNADPEFAKAHSERASERMKALHADPDVDMRQKHLRDMTPEQRSDYDALRELGCSKDEALAILEMAAE